MTPARRVDGDRAVSRAHLVPDGDFAGRVHSVFATACNLAVDGRLVSVHDAGAQHTPTSVRVAAGDAGVWSPATRVGDAVRCRAGALAFGGHVFDLRHVPVWAPGSVATPADAERVGRLVGDVAEARDRHLRVRGIAAWGPADLVDEVRVSLRTAPCAVDGVVHRLIGFGPGLTPAGDDLLVGLMAALHRVGVGSRRAEHALRTIVHGVLRDAHRTTDISAHYLRLAAAGEFGEPITGLVDALAGGASSAMVSARVDDVLCLGASSGADAVAGVLLGVGALVPRPDQKAA